MPDDARLTRLIALRDQLAEDINRPEGRWGMHGHSAVDDDYFAALEYVVAKMDEIISSDAPCLHDGGSTWTMEPVSRCAKCGMAFVEDEPIT